MIGKDKPTEDRIFEAATEVFLEKGMDGARMQDIADRAGINKSLLNYYYRSKDRLFNAVFEMIAIKMLEKFAAVLDKDLPIEEKLHFFFDEHISFLQKNPRLPLFLMNEIDRNPDRFKMFLDNIDVEKILHVLNAGDYKVLQKHNLTRESILQLVATIVSISVFPFAARGVLEVLLGRFGISFRDFVEERKKFAVEFVLAALGNLKR